MAVSKPEKDDERASRVIRQRSTLRFISELFLIGVFPKPRVVVESLHEVLDDKDPVTQLPIVVHFVKMVGDEFTGLKSRGGYGPQLNADDSIIGKKQQEAITQYLRAYTNTISAKYLEEYHALKRVERENHNMQHVRGDLTEEAKAAYDRALKLFEKLSNGLQRCAGGDGKQ